MVKSSYLCCAERARYRLGVGSTGAVLTFIVNTLFNCSPARCGAGEKEN